MSITNSDLDGIDSFIEEVLVNRFPGEPHKHTPHLTAKGLRFHCPYCGDTDSIRKTPRGNLYMESKRFRCFNDGCFASYPLESFVLKFSEEYDIDLSNMDLSELKADESDNVYFNNLVLTKDNNIYDYMDDMGLIEKLPHIDELIDLYGLQDIYSIHPATKVFNFLEERCAYAIPNLNKRVYSDSSDTRIFIMNVDDFTGRVLSYASRSVTYKSYIIQSFSDILKEWQPKEEIEEDHIKFLDMISSYFNIMNVDFTKEVNVTEGQFDAMFLPNYMALQGVSKISFILKHISSDKINILFDMDSAGYETTTRYMNNYGVFLWTLLIDNLKKQFSDDIRVIMKIHDINDLFKYLFNKSGRIFDIPRFHALVEKYTSSDMADRFFI